MIALALPDIAHRGWMHRVISSRTLPRDDCAFFSFRVDLDKAMKLISIMFGSVSANPVPSKSKNTKVWISWWFDAMMIELKREESDSYNKHKHAYT